MPGSDRFQHAREYEERRESLGWWHSFEFPDGSRVEGAMPIEGLRLRLAQFPIAEDLRGKRALDIGTWDGWFAFELERRGAEVVAIDVWDNPRFHEMRSRLGSRVEYRQLDVYDLDPSTIGRFDVVLFLGVLYHLKHPLLALERVCSVATDFVALESYVWQSQGRRSSQITSRPVMEFFETDEFGGIFDNWVAPTIPCLLAFCRTAGFARVDLLNVVPTAAAVACHRRWEEPRSTGAAPHLVDALHSRDYGLNFSSRRDDYVTAWFDGVTGTITISDVRPEVGGFGTVPVHVGREGDSGWQASFHLPPGLSPGWHPVRLRIGDGPPSNAVSIAVDLPFTGREATITGVADGTSWTPGAIVLSTGTTLSLWVEGLPDNADRANLSVILGDRRVQVVHLDRADPSRTHRQVNVEVPANTAPGRTPLRVVVGGRESAAVEVDVRA